MFFGADRCFASTRGPAPAQFRGVHPLLAKRADWRSRPWTSQGSPRVSRSTKPEDGSIDDVPTCAFAACQVDEVHIYSSVQAALVLAWSEPKVCFLACQRPTPSHRRVTPHPRTDAHALRTPMI